MRVALVDHLVCPRCGPPFALVLLAIEVRDRRIRRGEFGCPNCRDRFPVADGFGDLRPPPRGAPPDRTAKAAEALPVVEGAAARPASAVELAAALGVGDGAGLVVLPDSHRDEAAAMAQLVPGLEVLVVGWGGRGVAGSSRRISAFVTGPVLPLRGGVARGVVVVGGGEGRWTECLRVLVPDGRLVFRHPSEESRRWICAAGLAAIVDEEDWLVAVQAAPGTGPQMARWSP